VPNILDRIYIIAFYIDVDFLFSVNLRGISCWHAISGPMHRGRDANTGTRPTVRRRFMVRFRAAGRRRTSRILQRGGHGDADAARAVQRPVHAVAVRVRFAVQVSVEPAGFSTAGHRGRTQRPRGTGARHALQP